MYRPSLFLYYIWMGLAFFFFGAAIFGGSDRTYFAISMVFALCANSVRLERQIRDLSDEIQVLSETIDVDELPKVCEKCHGFGTIDNSPENYPHEYNICHDCNGDGIAL